MPEPTLYRYVIQMRAKPSEGLVFGAPSMTVDMTEVEAAALMDAVAAGARWFRAPGAQAMICPADVARVHRIGVAAELDESLARTKAQLERMRDA